MTGCSASYDRHREAYIRIFDRLGLRLRHRVGGVRGDGRLGQSEEFLAPSEIGEDTFVRSDVGYAANVEAVVTVAPPAQPIEGLPAAHVEDTPDTPTIETLVDLANARFPRADRPWTAADTLKNVVLTPRPSRRQLVAAGRGTAR